MLRWLMSTIIALLILIGLVLVLGYILKQGEVESNQLKAELSNKQALIIDDQQALLLKEDRVEIETAEPPVINVTSPKREYSPTDVIAIQLTHRACRQDKQCSFIHVPRAMGCALPINKIGLQKLTHYIYDTPIDKRCSDTRFIARCHQQRCEKELP